MKTTTYHTTKKKRKENNENISRDQESTSTINMLIIIS